jgi:hypothetical protein
VVLLISMRMIHAFTFNIDESNKSKSEESQNSEEQQQISEADRMRYPDLLNIQFDARHLLQQEDG